MKNVKKIFVLFATYLLILIVGQLIPREWIITNATKSYETLKAQGLYGEIVKDICWDNWTDSYFINAAVTDFEGNILEKAIANAYTVVVGEEKEPIEGIKYAINPEGKETYQVPYSRYWVGGSTLVKILLLFTDISGIRTIILLLALTLFGITGINVYNSTGFGGGIAFGLSILASMLVPNSVCLAFASDIIIMLITMNICWYKIKNEDTFETYIVLFGIIGSLCSYVAYWSFPLITLGMPLVYLSMIKLKDKNSQYEIIKQNFYLSISWSVGIISTVLIKQLLAWYVLGEQTGTEHLVMWTGLGNSVRGRFGAVIRSLFRQIQSIEVIYVLILAIVILIIMIKRKYFKISMNIMPYLFIASYPLLWWWIFYVHSGHGFVRHIYAISYFAVFAYLFVECKEMQK